MPAQARRIGASTVTAVARAVIGLREAPADELHAIHQLRRHVDPSERGFQPEARLRMRPIRVVNSEN